MSADPLLSRLDRGLSVRRLDDARLPIHCFAGCEPLAILHSGATQDSPGAHMSCQHLKTVLLRLDCGPGGIQYRRYCLACWCATSSAIPHKVALVELHGQGAPLADREQLHRAQEQAYRRGCNLELAL